MVTWQICCKEEIRKCIKCNCNIVEPHQIIVWNSARLRPKKKDAETKVYCFGGLQSKIWGTQARGKNEGLHLGRLNSLIQGFM